MGAWRRAPRQPADRPGGCAARPRAPSSPCMAIGQHACGRPRRGSVAAVLHQPPTIGRTATVAYQIWAAHTIAATTCEATGAMRGVNTGTAQRAADGSRVYPPGQPASRLDPHARARADSVGQFRGRSVHASGTTRRRPPSTGLVRDAEAVVGAVSPSGRAPDRPRRTATPTSHARTGKREKNSSLLILDPP